ncbi:MAG: ATP-dependent DNA helicase RecG, partial [Chloroflexi bacterium]|nr:ATP-dependent DNA helicase RecG [Chloroflexota bacterium]
IHTVRDLIHHFPFRHNDFAHIRKVSELEYGKEQTVLVSVWEATKTQLGGNPRRASTQAVVGDETGNVRAVWFNRGFIADQLKPGTKLVLSGKAGAFRGQLVFESPEYEVLRGQELDELIHTGRLVPVYPKTEGLWDKSLRNYIRQALKACSHQIEEFLPEDIRHREGLMGLQDAIGQMHYPNSTDDANAARRRLAFDEFLIMQLAMLQRRREWKEEHAGVALEYDSAVVDGFMRSLPFPLTKAQQRAQDEILRDVATDRSMSRMLQGDVGSGKTVVALAALLAAVSAGYQGVLMAPTEVLAEQHFLTVRRLLVGKGSYQGDGPVVTVQAEWAAKPIKLGLLIGSMTKKVKTGMQEAVSSGEVDILIGTHAVIQEGVAPPNLALAVVDEQHRFGVMQRATLREKGVRPHLLAMSATPIPRSLYLTLYGDLDISVLDEMPPGRQEIRTRVVQPEGREAAYEMVRKEVGKGRQVFVVCPLIQESDALQTRAATEEYDKLSQQVFPDLRVGLLHGKLPLKEKERVMGEFQQREMDILVATPVIEVGIDIPNASVMMIDGAERFGLSQLHQLRGRVGRGEHQSYCLLLSDSPGEDARERLRLVERLQDGFKLAEEDLRLRGPGDYIGTRQSGFLEFKVARLSDTDILAMARREATRLVDADPDLQKPEHAGIAGAIQARQQGVADFS